MFYGPQVEKVCEALMLVHARQPSFVEKVHFALDLNLIFKYDKS
jgi:hypothetical protein